MAGFFAEEVLSSVHVLPFLYKIKTDHNAALKCALIDMQMRFLLTWTVEQDVAFYLKPPAASRSPKNQIGTLARGALLMENCISAECVR